MNRALVIILKVLYWPLALILLILVPFGIKVATEPAITRYHRPTGIAVAIAFATALSGLTFLYFYKKKKLAISVAHLIVFLVALSFSIVADRNERAELRRRAAAAQSASAQAAARDASELRLRRVTMDACHPVVKDAQELLHQTIMLMMVQQAVVHDLADNHTEEAQQKAQNALDTIVGAKKIVTALKQKFAGRTFPSNLPDSIKEGLPYYNRVQVEKAKVAEWRADTLKGFAQSGDAEGIVRLVKADQAASKNLLPKDAEFEKALLSVCFSPEEKQ